MDVSMEPLILTVEGQFTGPGTYIFHFSIGYLIGFRSTYLARALHVITHQITFHN